MLRTECCEHRVLAGAAVIKPGYAAGGQKHMNKARAAAAGTRLLLSGVCVALLGRWKVLGDQPAHHGA